MMSRRELYLRALRREPVEALTWVANFDHWYGVNTANGTVPPAYAGLSCNDLARAVDSTLWRRVTYVRSRYDDTVQVSTEYRDDLMITRYRTPAGELHTVHQQAKDSSRTWFLIEHLVKTAEDLRPLRHLIDATVYETTREEYERELADVGDDGILLTCLPCIPYLQFAKTDVGYERAFYLMADVPEEVAGVLDAYRARFLDAYRLAAAGPLELISNGDNMDQLTCPPHFFEQYAVPFYHAVRDILHPAGKIAQGHWCGQLDQLIPLMPDCGLDVIEAVTPKPMSGVDMCEAMERLEGKITLQGGIPSVFMCEVGGTRDELVRYVENLLAQVGHCRGFVLGMGDNVPSDADFARVKLVSDVVRRYNAGRVRAGRA